MEAPRSDDYIKSRLTSLMQDIEVHFAAEALFLRAPMAMGLDDLVRRAIEHMRERGETPETFAPKLVVRLETTGGSIEVVERISNVFRHHYQCVEFIIPNFAYSAGTVLALSGDDIHMDYYSVLGPIDPQIRNKDGRWAPGMGYLETFDEFLARSKMSPGLSDAELEFLIRKFDAAELFALNQAKKHSEELIVTWLTKYKFKDWVLTEARKIQVTDSMKATSAKRIADALGNAKDWNTHGRGISMEILRSDRVNLKITDFGSNPVRNVAIRQYYDLMLDYSMKIGAEISVHAKGRFWTIGG